MLATLITYTDLFLMHLIEVNSLKQNTEPNTRNQNFSQSFSFHHTWQSEIYASVLLDPGEKPGCLRVMSGNRWYM